MKQTIRIGLAFITALHFSNANAFTISKNYQEVSDFIGKIAATYPANATLFELAKSDYQGVPIMGLKIGSGSVHALVVASHHGNEYGSVEVAKGVADSLAQNPIKDMTVYVIPVLNIGGYNDRNRYEKDSAGRSNDPNRDYPGPCGTEGPFHLKSTKALADFIERENIITSATLHTYWPAVVYPWGISTHDTSTPYDTQFQKLTALATLESKYKTGNSTEVVYPADGCYEDYAYWKFGIWSLLFELGFSHNPTQSAVDEMVKVNVPGLRRFIEEAPKTRAENHAFTGKCDAAMKKLDLHIE